MLAYIQHRGAHRPCALVLGKEKPRLREIRRRDFSMNELYLKEDFPSFPDSSIHFAGSLISFESGLKSIVPRGILNVLPRSVAVPRLIGLLLVVTEKL